MAGKSTAAKAAKKTTGAKKSTVEKITAEKKTTPVADTAVITGMSEEVVKKVVYEDISQVLTRDAEAGEAFGIGDAMPIYYL
ncbi:MAG: hypothetical protein K5853_05670 [Lachnospiraceae bacterium]|nr:hypothetical protein [Lachnospiraceae bacterium]